ncbi:hypothetical protein C1X64_25940 [Pseudomonas sp. GW456-E7]|nr:hypothetical protein C1X64_25940 [Pseudomonas sp. GW456-E7]
MGASLLAKAVRQPTSMLNDSPSSRAGSLPQVSDRCPPSGGFAATRPPIRCNRSRQYRAR